MNGDLTSNTQSMSNTIKKSKKKNQRQNSNTGPQPVNSSADPLISLETMLTNQLSAAKLSEQLIHDM